MSQNPSFQPAPKTCAWCNVPIKQPKTGRKLHYCSPAHRQAAFKFRQAQAVLKLLKTKRSK